MKVALYNNGSSREIDITNIAPEDEAFFTSNGIALSMEDVHGNMVVYADYGGEEETKEISFQGQRSCNDVMKALRERVERLVSGAGMEE